MIEIYPKMVYLKNSFYGNSFKVNKKCVLILIYIVYKVTHILNLMCRKTYKYKIDMF